MLAVTGITNKSLRALMTGLLGGATYTRNRASYDLARLRVNGLITRVPSTPVITPLETSGAGGGAYRSDPRRGRPPAR
ncbi:MAG TPA: hypothetical protein VEF72_02230 [Mycobacterium sp.]|nr:hypothetical protein [Mycobacterium sp.]